MMIKQLMMLILLMVWIVPTVTAQDEEDAFPILQSDFTILTGDVQRPNGLFWYDGYIYTSCAGDSTLYRLQDTTGETITYISGVGNAHSLYVEEGPVIWVADIQTNNIWRISTDTGRISVRNGLAGPWGLAPSATDDSFYITEWGSDNLINMSRDGQQIRVIAEGFENPSGLVVTEERIYVANNDSPRRAVEWIDMTSDDMEPQPLLIGLQNTTNLVMGADGLLYVAYALGTRGVVGRVDPETCIEEGGCTNVDVELVAWTELQAPLAGLTITPDMRLYVHTMFGTEIYWAQLPTTAEE
jgi:outer membrane protein assembly factor BamB